MSVPPTLMTVMRMLSVVTPTGLTLAHVKLNTLEKAKVVLVSSLLTQTSCGLHVYYIHVVKDRKYLEHT